MSTQTINEPAAKNNSSRTRTILTLVFALIILVPSMMGFVAKFLEFINTFREETGGVFAITPMVNYLLASVGFLLLLVWASINGMFHDIEQPKHAMLEQEQDLDRAK